MFAEDFEKCVSYVEFLNHAPREDTFNFSWKKSLGSKCLFSSFCGQAVRELLKKMTLWKPVNNAKWLLMVEYKPFF